MRVVMGSGIENLRCASLPARCVSVKPRMHPACTTQNNAFHHRAHGDRRLRLNHALRWLRRLQLVAAFQDQLEQALRSLAGGVRVGLGIRQAFIMTAEECRNPVKTEFTRVVGLSNVGVSLLDAFDQMAARMTNPETAMLARVLRVQSQTGGNLAGILAGLADTIRDRRRLLRRVNAITAQGRATGWLLGLLPVTLGGFLIVAEPTLREAMLFTTVGQLFLGIALGLDALSIFSIMKIVQIDP